MQNFLTEQDVARQIKISLASLRKWRVEQRGPQFVKVGALVRYRPEDLEEWMARLPKGGDPLSTKAAELTVMRAGR